MTVTVLIADDDLIDARPQVVGPFTALDPAAVIGAVSWGPVQLTGSPRNIRRLATAFAEAADRADAMQTQLAKLLPVVPA